MQLKNLVIAAAALAACTWSGSAQAARYFVDNTLGDVPAEQAVTVAEPKPVQLLIEFKSNGAANARATRYVTPIVTRLVTESGYFSQVSTSPVEGGAVLSVVIDNIFDRDAAVRAGMETGSSFFLNGNAVADNYVGSAEYLRGDDTPSIKKEARHILITAIGRIGEPENATRARNQTEALETVLRQIVARTLHDVVSDPAFAGAPAGVEAPAPADDPTTTAETTAMPAPEQQPAPAPAH